MKIGAVSDAKYLFDTVLEFWTKYNPCKRREE